MKNTEKTYTLPIYFGNESEKHEIHSNSLIVFVEAYSEIAKQFGITTSIKITPPENGGWKTNLFISISFVGVSPIFSLLTGRSTDEWAKITHQKAIETINNFIIKKTEEFPNEPKDELRRCIKQKNKIYKQFLHDQCIKTFNLDSCSSIPRDNFQFYIKQLKDYENIYLGKANIKVSSPDWKGKRSWQGDIDILNDGKLNSFDFNKNLTGKFWEKIELDALTLHTQDTMSVQLIERPAKQTKYRVIRVLQYNDVDIDSELAKNDIQKITTINNQSKIKNKQNQLEFKF